MMPAKIGKVYLVGAGPGDPGLLTLRGAECLHAADVIMYDYLASPELLANTRSDAELVCLGKHGRGRLWTQAEVNEAMIGHAQAGRIVVRLKGGDPTIFARVAEELTALEAAGVPFEIVPGVSAALAASSHAGISLTHRDHASCVAFVTGQQKCDKSEGEGLDYDTLASFPGTLVFYMGITSAPEWSRALINGGKSAETPVAIVRRCSFPDQESWFTTLGEVGALVQQTKLRPPAVVIVGDVAREPTAVNWFTSRPLSSKTILVTRPEQQSQDMAARLGGLGAEVLVQPAIEISEPTDWAPVDNTIERLSEFDWLVFSSNNGVHYFFERLLALGHDMRRLGGVRLAAIGPGTVEALAEYSLKADLQPEEYRAESLAAALAPFALGKRFFLARASRGREVLAEMLTNAGAKVEQAVVYESRDVTTVDEELAVLLGAGRIDWVTVTSSAIARSLAKMFGQSLRKTKLAAISPVTAEVIRELGFEPAAIAETYTTDGVIEAILRTEGHAD
jgi:uroporphyrinogen III methyltransferase / synthase